jgi:hypothetical protein
MQSLLLLIALPCVFSLTCVVKQVAISGGKEVVAQTNGPTCETDKWCRTVTAIQMDDKGVGVLSMKNIKNNSLKHLSATSTGIVSACAADASDNEFCDNNAKDKCFESNNAQSKVCNIVIFTFNIQYYSHQSAVVQQQSVTITTT